ncbi:hypothetical protein GOV08_05640, partial [Candidatus Woesearchaeota archaeon]|nr:hypothetical protein [Candidatus Woesearchaeota archaeon]
MKKRISLSLITIFLLIITINFAYAYTCGCSNLDDTGTSSGFIDGSDRIVMLKAIQGILIPESAYDITGDALVNDDDLDCWENQSFRYTPFNDIDEICDSLDNNCNGFIDEGGVCGPSCTDIDGDFFAIEGDECGPVDCNDNNPNVNPGANEICNGIDDNCDTNIDESNGDCSSGTPFCSFGSCVQCLSNPDCDDGLFCNGVETCNSGTCQAGTAINCGDGVSCTVDSCNEGTDSCDNNPNDNLCDNGLFCDGDETCDIVNDCESGTPPTTNDGVGCTVDGCDEVNDEIIHLPDDNLCLNGLYCDGAEFCDIVNDCQVGSSITCDDGLSCSIDTCDEGINTIDNIGSCDFDISSCTCLINSDCDDGNPCTDDICNAQLECENNNDNSNTCDDGFFCTVNDRCFSGTCISDTISVDDGVSCTVDSCDEVNDEVDHVADNNFCDNTLYCDGVETCDVVNDCQAGINVDCNDGVSCTSDSCIESSDSCMNDPQDSICDNSLFCDGGEFCDSVNDCQIGTPINCNDGVSCTVDSCNEGTNSCDNLGNDNTCDNGLFCDGSEFCDVVNDCQLGTTVDCSSNDIPSVSTCDNNPDNLPFTFDFFAGFTSSCDE